MSYSGRDIRAKLKKTSLLEATSPLARLAAIYRFGGPR